MSGPLQCVKAFHTDRYNFLYQPVEENLNPALAGPLSDAAKMALWPPLMTVQAAAELFDPQGHDCRAI